VANEKKQEMMLNKQECERLAVELFVGRFGKTGISPRDVS
jgi:hypothetical protein